MDTWKVYIKKKYKTALDRWNKETGGSNRQPWSFINYCDRDARWLMMIFIKDMECNYLLVANAGGRMPLHLQMESRTDPYTSGGEEVGGTRLTNQKRAVIEAENKIKKLKKDIGEVLSILTSMYKKKEDNPEQEKEALLGRVAQVNSALCDQESMNSMSPTTKAK